MGMRRRIRAVNESPPRTGTATSPPNVERVGGLSAFWLAERHGCSGTMLEV
jgi:hypothetical protein